MSQSSSSNPSLVYGIVEKWCEWREQVVIKKVALAIKEINNTLRTYKPFIQLIDNPELKDKFIDIITHVGRSEAIQLLMEELDDCDVDVACRCLLQGCCLRMYFAVCSSDTTALTLLLQLSCFYNLSTHI